MLWIKMFLTAAGFFTCAEAGWYLSGDSGTAVSCWLGGGLVVAVLLLSETRHWPWLLLSTVPVNAWFEWGHVPGHHPAFIGCSCLANLMQAGIGAWLVRRFVAERPLLSSLKEFFGVIIFAGVLGTTVGAATTAALLAGSHLSAFTTSLQILWGGGVMAVLVLTPLILVFCGRQEKLPRDFLAPRRVIEAAVIFGGLGLFMWLILALGGGINSPKVSALVFILWAGLRFGPRGGTLAVLFLALWAAFLTRHYHQGLPEGGGEYAFTLQSFVAVAALVGLVPALALGERDRTLARLRESEERFRTLTEAAFEAVFIIEHGRFFDANDQGLKMLGYQREELIGREVLSTVAPQSAAAVAEAMRTKTEAVIEHEMRRKNGSVFSAEARAKYLPVGGRYLEVLAMRDVTEEKRNERALRESEEKFSKAFRASPDGLALSELDSGRFIEINEGYCRMYGYAREEMLSHTSVELGIWENLRDRMRLANELKQTGIVRDWEVRTRNRAAELKIIHLSAESILLEGKPCLVSVLHDVTDRIQAEEAGHTQRKVLEMTASGQPMARTLDALLRMIESQADDMLGGILLLEADGMRLRSVAAPSLPADYLKAIDGAAAGQCADSCGAAIHQRAPVLVADLATAADWRELGDLALKNGLRACWSTPIFDAQRNVLGCFAVYRRRPGLPGGRHQQLIDMATQTAAICISRHLLEAEREQTAAREQQTRKEYTRQLIAAQEAERKRLAAELHDSLGQNLLLIKNLAEQALRARLPEPVSGPLTTLNQLAAQCISEARQIARDLCPHQLEHLGLKRALEAMLEHAAQASQIQFAFKFEPVDDLFTGDAALDLFRIVQESLNNILKHARATQVNIQLERDIYEVVLWIQDDGMGFVRESAASQKGLGLKNISERAHMLGGKLKIATAPGHGTRVEVAIPIAEKARELA